MSEKSKSQLKLDNNTLFPNNNNGFITPDKLRTFHNDLVDSFSTEDGITILSTELSSEISRAISTEASLSTSIDSIGGNAINQEISDRISADASLSTAISTETSTRISADASLSTAINNIDLSSYALSSDLSSEISRAIDVEASLSTAIGSGSSSGGDLTIDLAQSSYSLKGDIMMLEDGTAYNVVINQSELSYSVGTPLLLNSSSADSLFIRSESNIKGDKLLTAFVTSSNARLNVSNIVDGAISSYTLTSMSSCSYLKDISFDPFNDYKFILTYVYNSSLYMKIGTIDPSTNVITLGTAYTISGFSINPAVVKFNNKVENNFIVFYSETNTIYNLSVDDTTISLLSTNVFDDLEHHSNGLTINFDPFFTNRFMISSLGSTTYNHLVWICYIEADYSVKVIENVGTKIYDPCFTVFDEFNKNKILYTYNDNGYLYGRIGTLVGGSVTWGSAVQIGTNYEWSFAKAFYRKDKPNMVYFKLNNTSYNNTRIVECTIVDDVITVGSTYTVNTDTLQPYTAFNPINGNDNLYTYAYRTDVYTYVVLIQMPVSTGDSSNFDYSKYIGVSTKFSELDVNVKLSGVIDVDYGGTPDDILYIDYKGAISTSKTTDKSYKFGIVLEDGTTQLYDKNNILAEIEIDNIKETLNNLSYNITNLGSSVEATVSTAIYAIPTQFRLTNIMLNGEWGWEGYNYTLNRMCEIPGGNVVYQDGDSVYFREHYGNYYTNHYIVNGYLKKTMTYGYLTIVWITSHYYPFYFNHNQPGNYTSSLFIINNKTNSISSINTSVYNVLFNEKDSLVGYTIYDVNMCSSYIYDLKTETSTQHQTSSYNMFLIPKSDDNYYILRDGSIDLYTTDDSLVSSTVLSSSEGVNAFLSGNDNYDYNATYNNLYFRYYGVYVYNLAQNKIKQLGRYRDFVQTGTDYTIVRYDNYILVLDSKTGNFLYRFTNLAIHTITASDGIAYLTDNSIGVNKKIY